jgi:hypothetical protein
MASAPARSWARSMITKRAPVFDEILLKHAINDGFDRRS